MPLHASARSVLSVSRVHCLPLDRLPKLRVAGSRRRSRERLDSLPCPRTRSRAPAFPNALGRLGRGRFCWGRWCDRPDSRSLRPPVIVFDEDGVPETTTVTYDGLSRIKTIEYPASASPESFPTTGPETAKPTKKRGSSIATNTRRRAPYNAHTRTPYQKPL